MSAFIVVITSIQIITAPVPYNEASFTGIENLQSLQVRVEQLRPLQNYKFQKSLKRKTNWLNNIESNQCKMGKSNIISEWIVPVTVTISTGMIVYAVYHFRGR